MSIDNIMIARKAILAELLRRAKEKDPNVYPLNPDNKHRWHKPQDNYYSGAGVMNCPICKTGQLHYRRAGYNGHIHARCTNDACVSWME